ncbi:DUF6587 family protein [Piscinibacter sp.]|jgi:hypothetical protein|uniref:DUF6587 family protein n=1 Tax=Piscinibacter sp. TaxID=1903157 RepID=UPI00355A9EDA
MAAQNLIVALIVMACAAYAAWTLMPSAARRALAASMLKLTLPRAVARHVQRVTQTPSGCGACDGCTEAAPKPAPGLPTPLVFHRRLNR